MACYSAYRRANPRRPGQKFYIAKPEPRPRRQKKLRPPLPRCRCCARKIPANKGAHCSRCFARLVIETIGSSAGWRFLRRFAGCTLTFDGQTIHVPDEHQLEEAATIQRQVRRLHRVTDDRQIREIARDEGTAAFKLRALLEVS